jgi:hypothetical protein
MRRTACGIVLLALAATGCGDGRAIFNIDVFSFMNAQKVDTLPYVGPLPPGVPDTIPHQQVTLLPIGLEGSTVDSVHVTATINFVNQSGTGQVGFAIYIDSVPNVYASAPAFSIPPVNVSGTATSQGALSAELLASLRPLFARSQLFIGARVTSTATAPPVSGVARITGLDLRIVLQDKVF